MSDIITKFHVFHAMVQSKDVQGNTSNCKFKLVAVTRAARLEEISFRKRPHTEIIETGRSPELLLIPQSQGNSHSSVFFKEHV